MGASSATRGRGSNHPAGGEEKVRVARRGAVPRPREPAELQWPSRWHPTCRLRGAGGQGSMSETTDEGQRPTILVVDDEADVRALVREILTLNGYHVIDTGDPFEARRIVAGQPGALLLPSG